jgi:hypothetical protein
MILKSRRLEEHRGRFDRFKVHIFGEFQRPRQKPDLPFGPDFFRREPQSP